MNKKEMSSENLSHIEKKKRKEKDIQKADSCLLTMRSLRNLAEKEAKLVKQALKDMEDHLIDPGYILDLTKSIHVNGSKNVSDYINRNTEILLNKHSALVRQKVIQQMKKQIQDMNSELSQDAKKLSDDISNFFDYIQSNYEDASASFHKVVELAKSNYKKLEQLNEMEDKLFALRNELQELEQQLLECLMCYAFLGEIAPQEYGVKENMLPKQFLRSFGPKYADEDFDLIQKNVLEDILEERIFIEPIQSDVRSKDVLKFLEHFKDSNFSLVRNNYHTNLQPSSIGHIKTESSEKMKDALEEWNLKISAAEKDIEEAKEKNENLENQINYLMNEDLDGTKLKRENELKKIIELYKLCTNSEVQYMDLELMKVAIEDALENLFHELDLLPKKKVKEMLKILDAEKRLGERKAEEALRAQRASERKGKVIRSKKEKIRKGS